MDYQGYEHQNQKTLSQFTNPKFLKQVTKFLLSVSVFSLFFSHSTWLSFHHSFNFYSTLPIRLFSHTLDKNYIFLLCNGLLVFLAKFSGLLSSSSSSYSSSSSSSSKYNLNNEYYFKNYEAESRLERIVMETEIPLLEKETGESETIDQTTQQNAHQVVKRETEEVEQEAAEEIKAVIEEDEQEKTKEAESDFFMEEAEEEEEEEENREEREEQNGMLSTEELNKKFEDFIRKMKEELRIEARQQLVMV